MLVEAGDGWWVLVSSREVEWMVVVLTAYGLDNSSKHFVDVECEILPSRASLCVLQLHRNCIVNVIEVRRRKPRQDFRARGRHVSQSFTWAASSSFLSL